MSVIISAIAAAATRVGAELVGKVVGGVLGEKDGDLAETVVNTVAERLGVEPERIPAEDPKILDNAVRDVEVAMPEIMGLWAKGLEGQFALLQAETAEGFWQSAWRWGWMYLLAVFWTFYILVFPIMSAFGLAVERIDVLVLLTLTTWFISLYMGGHTVKALGESAINAVRSWKGKA